MCVNWMGLAKTCQPTWNVERRQLDLNPDPTPNTKPLAMGKFKIIMAGPRSALKAADRHSKYGPFLIFNRVYCSVLAPKILDTPSRWAPALAEGEQSRWGTLPCFYMPNFPSLKLGKKMD
jgi:hypothetical protein